MVSLIDMISMRKYIRGYDSKKESWSRVIFPRDFLKHLGECDKCLKSEVKDSLFCGKVLVPRLFWMNYFDLGVSEILEDLRNFVFVYGKSVGKDLYCDYYFDGNDEFGLKK